MKNIRKDIILNDNILYFDYTASGLAYAPIEEKIIEVLKTYANTHSEVSSNAIITNNYYNKARDDLKIALELDNTFYVMPTGTGATAAIKKFQELMGLYIPPMTKKRYKVEPNNVPLVFVGPYEHHSNEISFREALCEVIRVPLSQAKQIDLEFLEEKLKQNIDREIIVSFSVASNVTGVISDYKSIYTLIKKYGGVLCLDAAAASPYINIDCNYYDAIFLSPHKLLGGVGSCGILIIKKELCTEDKPTFAGGGTVAYVSRKSHEFLTNKELIEDAGTPGIIQFIRASLAYKLRNKIGLSVIKDIEEELKKYFEISVKKIDGLQLYSSFKQDKLPIFSINFKGSNPFHISQYLSDKYNIQTRAGCSCAGPYGHDLLNLEDGQEFDTKPGWLRVSMHFTHTKDDIDILIKGIKEAIEFYS